MTTTIRTCFLILATACNIVQATAQQPTKHRPFDETARKQATDATDYQEETTYQKEQNNQPSDNKSQSQTDAQHRPFDEKKRREATENTDFKEDKPKAQKERQETETSPPTNTFPTPSEGTLAMLKAFSWLLLIGIIGLILFFILRLVLGDDWFRRKRIANQAATEIDLADIENNLMEAELTDPIQRAIRDGNYALALRLYYLQAIQSLAQRELITWKRHKTNRDYLRELGQKPQSAAFAQITRQFEDVWYGGTQLSKTTFEQAEQTYKTLLSIP